jgi:hypothetical protein
MSMTEPTPEEKPTFHRVTEEEIAALADKLAASGETLAPDERALLEVLVQRARTVTPADVRAEQFRTGLTDALRGLIDAQQRAWGADKQDAWVRIDPIWVRGGASDLQIAARVATGSRAAR